MLDIKFIRENPEIVKEAAKNKKANVDVDRLLLVDGERKKLQAEINSLNEEKNIVAKKKDIERGRMVKEALSKLTADFNKIDEEFNALMLFVPNIPSPQTPVGADETGNAVLRKVGEIPKMPFKPLEHWQLGEKLGVIDTETAAKVAGSRFNYLFGDLVLLEFALAQFVFKTVTDQKILEEIIDSAGLDLPQKPFIPAIPPVFIRPEIMQKMARLEPKEDRYFIQSDNLYLIGSAEHTLGPMQMNKTLAEEQLPLRYIGFSTAFRREAGSYGKDTKGILRVHQFDKLEMESFTLPENSENEQAFLVAIQEHILKSLKLPYQVVEICTGDMGLPDYRQIDIETWMPGQGRYRETHTSDFVTDFQSRRLNIKVKRSNGSTQFVHMNDATASAGRTLIAIMENYQQRDGSIKIPEILRDFMFGKKEIKGQ